MRFLKSLPQCLTEVLNAELAKLKKKSRDYKDVAEILDMSASYIDGGPK